MLEGRDLVRHFRRGPEEVRAVDGVSLTLETGCLLALTGPSGAGKSTLLRLLSGLERPDSGEIWCESRRIDSLGEKALTRVRRDIFGYLFQDAGLIGNLTVQENVLLPGLFGRDRARKREVGARAIEWLGILSMEDRRHQPVRKLSVGQRQLVALARALVRSPRFLFADEPTGRLGEEGRREIFARLAELSHASGMGILVATHDLELAKSADRRLHMEDGRLVNH